MTKPHLLTTAEVAERLGVSARTVARYAEAGELPVAQRLPGTTGALLFDLAEVEKFLASTEASA